MITDDKWNVSDLTPGFFPENLFPGDPALFINQVDPVLQYFQTWQGIHMSTLKNVEYKYLKSLSH